MFQIAKPVFFAQADLLPFTRSRLPIKCVFLLMVDFIPFYMFQIAKYVFLLIVDLPFYMFQIAKSVFLLIVDIPFYMFQIAKSVFFARSLILKRLIMIDR